MTAKIKLNAASGGGSFSLQAPSSSANNRVFTLPDVADATMATVNGISEFDQFILTASKTDNSDITANLARVSSGLAGAASQIGTGMSESSGIFSFPTTGKYLVIVAAEFAILSADNCIVYTNITTNNSSYSINARAVDGNNGTGERSGNATSFSFIDVTDVSQVKVKFSTASLDSGSSLNGSSGTAMTSFTFIRIGDT